MTKTFAITPALDLLLRGSESVPAGLYQLHLATAEQLCRLHYKAGMLKTVSKRLKQLVDNGYIQADCIPTKSFKSPYYYTLSYKAMHYLEAIGFDTDPSFRASKEVSESYLHLRHALELNDVLIASLRLKYADPRFYLSRYQQERLFKRSPLPVTVDGAQVWLIPDGLLEIRQRRQLLPDIVFGLLVEHDRGTEQQEHFKRRIQAYRSLLSSGVYKQLVGIERVAVAFTTFKGMKRVSQMQAWTGEELQAESSLSNQFLFADLPRPLEPLSLFFERRWHTLTSDQPIPLLER